MGQGIEKQRWTWLCIARTIIFVRGLMKTSVCVILDSSLTGSRTPGFTCAHTAHQINSKPKRLDANFAYALSVRATTLLLLQLWSSTAQLPTLGHRQDQIKLQRRRGIEGEEATWLRMVDTKSHFTLKLLDLSTSSATPLIFTPL